jgi:predicted TIM-barrel fold metal-dependent hydrolase
MASMAERTKSYPVFDCDAHIYESRAIWDYLPASERELVRDHGFWADDEYAGIGLLNGVRFAQGVSGSGHWGGGLGITPEMTRRLHQMALTPEQRDYLTLRGGWQPDARLRELDQSGIDQVLVIPTSFNAFYPFVQNFYAARALARAYNDWAHDFCAYAPERLFAAALLPVQEPSFAADELYRVAAAGRQVALIRPVDANGTYPNDPNFAPLWQAFEETGMLLSMHPFPGGSFRQSRYYPTNQFVPRDRATQASPSELIWEAVETTGLVQGTRAQDLCFIWESMVWLNGVLLSGFLEQHPRLRMAIFESNAAWLPVILEACDKAALLHRNEMRTPLKHLPSETFLERCIISFESDETDVYRMWDYFENIGVWASDQYHPDAEDAWEAIEELEAHGVPAAVQAKLMGSNAAKAYGIEPKLFVTQSCYAELEQGRPAWFPTREDVEAGMTPEAALKASAEVGLSPLPIPRGRSAAPPLHIMPNQIPDYARSRPPAPPSENGHVAAETAVNR